MTATTPPQPAPEQHAPEQGLAALHAGGPSSLAELLGDVDHLLTSLAIDPQKMFEVGARPRQEIKNLLDMIHGALSSLAALEARTLVAFAEAHLRDRIDAARDDVAHEDDFLPPLEQLIRQADRRTTADITLATHRSPSAANSSLAAARRLVGTMPRMLSALGRGVITPGVAYAAATTSAPLTDQQRRDVDQVLHERLPEMEGAGVKAWRGAVVAAVGELDPDGAASRHLIARRSRHVTLTPGEHGMATLSAHLPALDAKRVHKRLSLEAERRRAEGDREGHGALMADALVATLLGRDSGLELETLDVGVIITDRALLSPEHGDAAYIEGYGPVPAEALRAELRAALAAPEDPACDRYGPDGPSIRAVLRKLFQHPTRGEIVAVESRAREFPRALKRFLHLRDGRCRAPYCDAHVRQYDHITPHSRGGATSLDNGQGLCGHDNLGKEDGYATVERRGDQAADGHQVEWTGHSGASVVRRAQRLGPTAFVVMPDDSVAPDTTTGTTEAVGDSDGEQLETSGAADGEGLEIRGTTDSEACTMTRPMSAQVLTRTIPTRPVRSAGPSGQKSPQAPAPGRIRHDEGRSGRSSTGSPLASRVRRAQRAARRSQAVVAPGSRISSSTPPSSGLEAISTSPSGSATGASPKFVTDSQPPGRSKASTSPVERVSSQVKIGRAHV